MCKKEGCSFLTALLSIPYNKLTYHKKRRNHFLSEEERITAKAEASREIEQKPITVDSADESGSNHELDITIPLTKNCSPSSKITSYFKPVEK